ncbi:hypothetical protein ScPMuIL_018647 [Solemya velum]
MTIYKFLQSEKKTDKPVDDPEVVTEPLTNKKADSECAAVPRTIHVSYRPRRSRTCLNLFLILVALLVLSAGVIGGVYLYKHLSHKVFRGRCGVEYMDESLYPDSDRLHYMEEDIEVSDGKYERIQIPKFDECEDALVLHDFEKNYTAIVDHDDRRCFVMRLDRRLVAPPTDLIDLISKVNSGYYIPKAEVVRQKFRVMTPPLDDIRYLGPYILRECLGYHTYELERMVGDGWIEKRDTGVRVLNYAESSGNKLMKFRLHYSE